MSSYGELKEADSLNTFNAPDTWPDPLGQHRTRPLTCVSLAVTAAGGTGRWPGWTTALKETLAARGILDELKAKIRAEVFRSLEDDLQPRPAPAHETQTINGLIREYLEWNGFRHSLSVFELETGSVNSESPTRDQLCEEFGQDPGVFNDPSRKHRPLLYDLVYQNSKAPLTGARTLETRSKLPGRIMSDAPEPLSLDHDVFEVRK
ncbi:uncharacterized protein BJ171DRAFT_598027 [Polychytrium aggregatum]|uniref:uncharacterized protein n=1 Tax=Polychytrium aggregatum TaxID=110093 RepID=UPI0022FE4A7F|nr:uncharacterized protein BJ171DRAFT_598027 [Polychytrium aggregatum]KAI9205832.1 hypothetical protein BJ171DRAFT_598027 [Polychytrium aggregatum]